MINVEKLIKELQKLPNQKAEVLFFEDLNQDPEDCMTLQFKDIKIDYNQGGWVIYINLQDY